MHEATCTNCGRDVQITPDAEFCSACGENLKALIPLEKMSQYFYDRIAVLAETASTRVALDETQRALDHVASPELQLLGAILAEGAGEYDLMRRYVSRIPVADRLRDEGEWLLRSHQARQSAHRSGGTSLNSYNQSTFIPSSTEQISAPETSGQPFDGQQYSGHSFSGQRERADEELLSMRTRRIGQLAYDTQVVGPTREVQHAIQPINALEPNQASRRLWPALLTLLLLFAVIWGGWQFLGGTDNSQQASGDPEINQGSTQDADIATDAQQNGAAALEPQVTIDGDSPAVETIPATVPADNNLPDNTPDNTSIPDDVVDNNDNPLSVADLENSVGVSRPFDLSAYLLNQGRADLAAFRLDATLQDNLMVISGAVNSAEERQDVIALAETTSDLVTISALELLVRQPDTYIIEDGDTLWLIADKLYGDGERWQEIYDANLDILASPDAIVVGQTLKVPQDQ